MCVCVDDTSHLRHRHLDKSFILSHTLSLALSLSLPHSIIYSITLSLAGLSLQVAIIYDSPVTETKAKITYGELHHRVERFAFVLQRANVQMGDRVVIYMPMVLTWSKKLVIGCRMGKENKKTSMYNQVHICSSSP